MFAKLATTAALLAFATPALAVTVISNAPGAPDPGAPAGTTVVADFSSPLAPGVTNTTSGSVVTVSGSMPGQYAQPAPVSPLNAYQAVQGNGVSTFSFTNALGVFSFYWGSIDTYNKIEFLRGDGTLVQTFTGAAFAAPANGNQTASATNRRVTFGFTGAEAVKQVRFSNSPQTNAFEFDTLAIAAIPEPTTWAMMILGFGLIGGAMRSRKAVTARLTYA
jgi:hypothetical protein